MNLNKVFVPKKGEFTEQWKVIDAQGQVVGRLASRIIHMIKGKDDPRFTANCNTLCRIIVINAEKVVLTGKKMTMKIYRKHTRYVGNDQEVAARDMMKKDGTAILRLALKRMLHSRSPLNRELLDHNVLIYEGNTHPHIAQVRANAVTA